MDPRARGTVPGHAAGEQGWQMKASHEAAVMTE